MPLRAGATDEDLAVVQTKNDLMRHSRRFEDVDQRAIGIDALDFHLPSFVITPTLLNNRL
jgi:hypothetical protein